MECFDPPEFTEDDFSSWKRSMYFFLGASDYKFCDIIENGLHIRNKPKNQWSEEDKKLVELDLNVMNIITMSLPKDVLDLVVFCDTAKDMWDSLCEIYEGTEDVKELKKSNLNKQYELFIAKEDESVADTFKRFSRLLNDLRVVGVRKENISCLNRFMDALPDHWDNLIMCMRMSNRLKKMSLPGLYGTFLCHEKLKAEKKTARKSKAHFNQGRGENEVSQTYDSETSSSSDYEYGIANMFQNGQI